MQIMHLKPVVTSNQLLLARIQNVGAKFVEALNELPHDQLIEMLTLEDEEFWGELKKQAQFHTLINTITPAKKAHEDLAEAREINLSLWINPVGYINQP
ncbi:hypothetical protein [Buttiauxella agrestis]|uniref:hypothetical protein n=1 Tax=Buttiauxella agrestis TaxID=82977 RepID=UPI0039747E16